MTCQGQLSYTEEQITNLYNKLDRARLYARKVSREAPINTFIVLLSLDKTVRLASNIIRLILVA